MKKNKIKLFVTLSFALLMAFGNVNSVSAAKSATKSTPYGTLKGFISPYNSGSSKLCEGGTTIGQNVKSIKIKIEAKKTSTGANIGSTQNQHANSSGVGDTLECWGYAGTKVTFYGTHDAIHTTGYHVYTSTQYQINKYHFSIISIKYIRNDIFYSEVNYEKNNNNFFSHITMWLSNHK